MTIVSAMGAAIKLNECYDEHSGEKLPPRVRAGNSNRGGGSVDEILKRLGTVESAVSDIREQVSGIAAIIPHLATKTDVSKISEVVSGIAATIPHLATKADLNAVRGEISAMLGNISALEVRLLKWMVPTVIASAGLIFTITKFVH
jgi:hypothetical protein